MPNTEEIQVLFRSFFKEAEAGQPQFILSPSPTGRTPEDLSPLGLTGQSPLCVQRSTVGSDSAEPYFPFLGWIRQALGGQKAAIAQAIEAAEVYFLHRELFQTWLEGGAPVRREEWLEPEIRFEQRMMHTSLWRLFFQVFRGQTRLFIVDQFQNLPPASLEALLHLHHEPETGGAVFFFNFEAGTGHRDDEYGALWARFWEVFDEHKLTLSLPGNLPPSVRSRRPRLGHIGTTLAQAAELLAFHCVLEARALAHRLFSIYDQNRPAWTEDELIRLYELLGEADLLSGQSGAAVSHWNYLLSLLQDGRPADRIRLSWKLSMAFHAQKDYRKAQLFAQRGLELAEEHGDKRGQFYALFHLLLCEETLLEMDFAPWKDMYRRYLSLGQELDYTNALSYWLVNPYHMDSQDYIDEAAYYHDWGIGICEQHKNLYRLSDAYMQKGYFWTIKGDWEGVLECYKKSEEMKLTIGQKDELPYVRNGRGFFLLGIGRHLEAQENFLLALEGLKNQRNYNEIGLTLYNLGVNAFLSGDFAGAVQFLTKLQRLLISLDLRGLTFHSRYEILLMTALASYKAGKTARALETWVRAKECEPAHPTVEEQLLAGLMKVWIQQADGQTDEAIRLFREVEAFLTANLKALKFYVPFVFQELGFALRQAGQDAEAVKAFKHGYMETFQFPNMMMRERLHSFMTGHFDIPAPPPLPEPNIDFDWIIDSAKHELSVLAARRQTAELGFYRDFMALIVRAPDQAELIGETMRLLQKDFFFDGVFFYFETGRTWEEGYLSHTLSDSLRSSLLDLLPELRRLGDRLFLPDLTAHPLTAETGLPYQSLVSIHAGFSGEVQAQLLAFLGPGSQVPRDTLNGLYTTIRHLTAFLGRGEREKRLRDQNRALKTAATKDPLTGLFNRRSLQERISTETARLRRLGTGTFSVLFIDLDGFQNINHNFGHIAGDIVLKYFSDLLQGTLRQEDMAARFTGDEFVLLLLGTNLEGAALAAARIQELVKDPHWYAAGLPPRSLAIPRDDWPELTVSIGKAELPPPGQEQKILALADADLVRVKAQNKDSQGSSE